MRQEPVDPSQSTLGLLEHLLKQPFGFLKTLTDREAELKPLIVPLAVTSMLGLALFGLLLGAFSGGTLLWASPLKVVLGTAYSALICLPSLYVFSAMTGSTFSWRSVAYALLAMLAMLSVLLVAFAPVLWVFATSTESMGFYGTLGLIVWVIAFLMSGSLIKKLVKVEGAGTTGPLSLWLGVFLLVLLQTSTSIRPLLVDTGEWFTGEKKFFLQHWIDELAGEPVTSRTNTYEKGELEE